jgi:glycosyltransferase involved in cell wall biosynthesis
MPTKRRTKIFIVTECPYVGIFQAILDLSKMLNALGFQLVYVFPTTPKNRYGEKQVDHEKILEKYGDIRYTPQRRKYRYLISDLYKFIKFSRGLNNGDIIISFTEYAGKLTRLCRLFNGNIKYYHEHQCIDVFRKKKFAYYFELIVEKLLSQSIDFYIACSPSEVSLLQNTFKVPSDKIIFVPNYRDFKDDEPETYLKKQYDFVYVGRIVQEKGVAKLAEAFNSLGICDKLICIGDGADLAHLRSTYPEITFFGHLDHGDVLRRLRKSKFMISNSQIEGLPYSVLEAMNLGVVPILSSVHGHKDLVVSGITGFLYKSTEEMRNLLFKVMNFDAKIYNEISSNVIKLSKNLELFGKNALKNHFKKYD